MAAERRRVAAEAAAKEEERQRLAEAAAVSREARRADAEAEELRIRTEVERREREAAELTHSVPVGMAGVESGLRRLREEAEAKGGQQQCNKTLQALEKVLKQVLAHPEDPRFKAIKSDNESYQQDIGYSEGAVLVLLSSGFKVRVEEGRNVLCINEPDPLEDMDAWAHWHDVLKSAVRAIQMALEP
ncbi:unnamed protein product [Chrysoparadoxa australica]